jgi:hypothetical protein
MREQRSQRPGAKRNSREKAQKTQNLTEKHKGDESGKKGMRIEE